MEGVYIFIRALILLHDKFFIVVDDQGLHLDLLGFVVTDCIALRLPFVFYMNRNL